MHEPAWGESSVTFGFCDHARQMKLYEYGIFATEVVLYSISVGDIEGR